MVKLLHPKILQKLSILLLFFSAITAWGQTNYTISRGIDGTNNVIPGITVSYNGATSCATASNGSTALKMTLTAQTGYTFTINTISGNAVRSGSGPDGFQFELVNTSTSTGTQTGITGTSSCSGGTAVSSLSVPVANRTVASGGSATINIKRNVAGGGYSHMKTLNVAVTVTPPSAPVFGGTGAQTFTYGTAASYTYTLTGSPAPTVSATYNSSTTLPAGITLDSANKQIDVSATAAPGTYDILISATNTQGSDTHNVALTINPANQTIGNFTSNIIKAYGDPNFNLGATATSGLAVTYDSSDSNVATISNNTVTIVGVGTANITASQPGNSNYNPATDVVRTLTVNQASQTITFSNIIKNYGDADFNLIATGGASGEAITYVSSDPTVATITGSTVHILKAGVINITASQAGNTNYSAATDVVRTLTVNKLSQTISFSNMTRTYGDADFTLTATGGASGEAITYVSSDAAVATILGDVITITGAGTANITASQAGNDNYDAATNVVRTITVDPKTITITGITGNDKAYDGNTTATVSGATLTPSEIVGSDDVALGTYTASFSDAAVAANKTITATYQLTGAQAGRYALTQATGITADITPKQLTITGVQINNKTYDGTTTAIIAGTASLVGIVNTDDVTLDTSAATAAFTDPNIAAGIPVTVTGYALGGLQASYYSLLQPQGLTASITSVALLDQTITFGSLANVAYGDPTFSLNATSDSGLTISYSSSDTSVATVTGNVVTILTPGTTTITANQSGDSTYNPALSVPQQLTVNTKTLTVSGAAIADKTYNQSTTAVASGTLTGVINSDDVTLTSAGTFTASTAGNNIPVTAQYSITGTDAAKYTLTQPTVTGNILPVSLTIAGAAAANKAYDSNTNAVVTGALTGVLVGDTVTFNGTGTFADKNMGTGIAVTSTSTLSGADAANYTLTQPTGLTANITGLVLTVNATAADKEYDRTTNAAITVSQINGLVSGDDVTVTGNGIFNNFNAGTAKPVTAALSLSGADAANYTLTQPTGLTAAITKKTVTIDTVNTSVTTKVYSGTSTATLVNVTLIGVVAGDESTIGAAGGNFAQNTPGTAIPVNNISLNGSSSINYQLTQPTTLTGDILPKQLTLVSPLAQNKVYNGNTIAVITGNLSGKVVGDTVTLNGTGTFATENVGNAIAVTSTATLAGTEAGNYVLVQPTGLTANITAKSLTITATAADKVYDQTTSAVINNGQIVASGIISGDDVSLASTTVTGTFINAAVGTNKNVTPNFTLQGTDAGNYSLSAQTFQAAITPLALTADITSAMVSPKTYDATTSGAVITGAVLNGVLAGDTVTTTGTFASANVGTGIAVTLNLAGISAANYTLTQPSPGLSGEIIKKTLIATADNITKTQGTANPALTITYSGFAGGQTAATAAGFTVPTLNTTANATTPVGAYPITISGGSADNYALTLVEGWMIIVPPVNTVFNPGTLWSNDITDSAPYTSNPFKTGESIQATPYITVSGVGRGSGITGTAAGNRYNANGWGLAFDANDYFYFTITPANGYKVNFTNFVYSSQVSTTAPPNQFAVKSSVDNYTATIGTATSAGATINLIGIDYQNITSQITFRIYAWGGTNTGATFSVNDFSFSGSVTQIPVTTAPQITSTLAASSFVGESEQYQVTVTGTPAIAISATNLPAGATIDANGLITFDGTTPAGVYNISLKAASFYGTVNKVLVYTINKETQFLTFTPDPLPNKFANDIPFTISVTNSAPLAITYSSSDTNVATIAQDGTITIVGAGTTTITASNTGDAMYNAVSLGKVLTVLPTPQITATPASIAFTAIQGQGASSATQLSLINGINLVPAADNITLTTSTGFELAMGIGTYSTTANFAYTGGTFNQVMPQIFVRLAAGQAVGTYNGTLTISGGNATIQIPLSAIVDPAPAITTTAAAFGPYCSGSDNIISVAYTTQGAFGAGNYYVQHSDATGVFPTDFSNIISSASTTSPISATLPSTFIAGNYRVRVVHLSSGLVLTSGINDNGSDITINTTVAPTATALTFCNSATVANLTAIGTDLKWYAAATGGTQLLTTDAVTTGNYFVSQTLNTCESTRTQVAVTVNVTPAPTGTALTFCNSATVANLTATGTDLKWYAAANGGSQLLATDAVTTGNYFVSQTLNNCEGPRAQVAVTVNVTPAPTATALTFCNSATVANLTATGTDLKWYAAANGGSLLLATDAVTTGNYFVSQTLNNCEGPRAQVAVTVNITPIPTASALTFCNSATVANLTATGTNLKWYAAATGGTQLLATDAVTTGNYFVSQTLNNCEGPRAQVAVTVNVTPAPTATALTFCNSATVANLTATGTNLKWYAAVNGGTQLLATDAVTTGNYFVSQTLNNCEGPRAQVAVTVNVTPAPIGTALTFCNSATVANLTATGTNLKWYSAANGGTQLLATDVVTTGNYFVSQTLNNCEGPRAQVAVTVNVTPAPTATALTFCNSATVANLTATGTNLKWYATVNGGSQLLATDAVTTGNYFVSQTLNNCEGPRAQVAVTVNVTPAPTGSALTFTSGATVSDLTATGTNLKWYAAANGGSQLNNIMLLSTGSYFVSQTVNGCESARTEIVVTITIVNPAPPAPIAGNLELCNGATVASLIAEGLDLRWYEIAAGGTILTPTTLLETGNYFVTQTINGIESERTEIMVTINVTPQPEVSAQNFCQLGFVSNLTATGTNLKWYNVENNGTELAGTTPLATGNYFVSQTLNGCESARAQVQVTVNTIPTPAPAAQDLTLCAGSTIADLIASGTDLKWYSDISGGTEHLPGTVVVAGNYYVSQTLNGCESTRTLVAITLTTTALPIIDNQTFCEGATVADLLAAVTGTEINIYASLTEAAPLENTTVMANGNYYVSQAINGCESQRKEVLVTIHATPAPTGDAEQLFAEEGHTIADMEAEGENITWYASEADAIAGINPLPETTVLVTETTYYATQATQGCESNSTLAVTVTVTLGRDEIQKFSFRYFPNPVSDNLQIQSEEAITNVKVFSLTGQLVMDKNMNTQTGIVNMSHLESGVYIVKISFGDIEKTIRIVREK